MERWHKANKEHIRGWWRKHPELRRRYYRKWRRKLKKEVLSHYSPNMICQWPGCKWMDVRALTLDHIKGDGSKHRREMGGAGNTYNWVKKHNFPKGFQVLCMNHQLIKRIENNENPPGKQIVMEN